MNSDNVKTTMRNRILPSFYKMTPHATPPEAVVWMHAETRTSLLRRPRGLRRGRSLGQSQGTQDRYRVARLQEGRRSTAACPDGRVDRRQPGGDRQEAADRHLALPDRTRRLPALREIARHQGNHD